MFCLENKSVCKGGFVFVMITEIFWRTFWRDNWRSLIVAVENFRLCIWRDWSLIGQKVDSSLHHGGLPCNYYLENPFCTLVVEASTAKRVCQRGDQTSVSNVLWQEGFGIKHQLVHFPSFKCTAIAIELAAK